MVQKKMENLSRAGNDDMENLIPGHVTEIRSVLEDEYDTVIPNRCDEFIARCLRTKDGNLEKTVKLIRAYQGAISNFEQWDARLQPSVGMALQNAGITVPMSHRDSNGRFVIILRPRFWDLQLANFDQIVAILWMITQHLMIQMKDVQTQGFVTILDFSGFTLQQAWAIKQWRLLSLCKWLQNGVAGRIKAIHSVNHPKIIGLIYKGIKPFLKEKLKKRITLHDNVDSLVKQMGTPHLPTFLGGDLDPKECYDAPLVERFFESDQFFQDMSETGFPSK